MIDVCEFKVVCILHGNEHYRSHEEKYLKLINSMWSIDEY